MLRWIAGVLNVLLFLSVVYLIVTQGTPASHEREFPFFLLVIVTPPLTVIALAKAGLSHGDGLLALWLKRRAAEERKKLRELESESDR